MAKIAKTYLLNHISNFILLKNTTYNTWFNVFKLKKTFCISICLCSILNYHMFYILVQSSLDMVSVNANLTTVTLANDKLQRPVHRSLNNHRLFPTFFFCTLPLVLHIQLLPQQDEHLHLIKI